MPLPGGARSLTGRGVGFFAVAQPFDGFDPGRDFGDGHWSLGLHGKNLLDKKYIVAGYNFLYQNPYTGEFVGNGIAPGPALGVPGYDAALGREGVLTAYYGNPRQVFFTVGYKY